VSARVDPALCSGTGYCVHACPEVFVLGGDAKAQVLPDVDWAAVDRRALEHAEESCPWGAITLVKMEERRV